MNKLILCIILLFPLCLVAQKRNEIKFIGADIDMMLKPSAMTYQTSQISNRFAGFVGYKRLIGSRVSVGLTFHKFINYQESAGNHYSNYLNYDFNQKAWGLGYHSRYFFDDHDNDGANSAYIEFSLNRTSLTQYYANMVDGSYNNANTPLPATPANHNYHVTRLGLTIGAIGSDILTRDISLGVYYNASSGNSPSGLSLTDVRGVSFILSYSFGIAF